eukprot:gnl/Spiro4/13047_TR6920_c0_g1_i1.p1 gnl/Spiro4/13047_TR6920_c0_g1~~gnl/Spiro4/13047_TR6920_c0_g1_i1.p1  ORF type:complete len:313 (-),score=82.00 gnl/Spiro4/13047_TR6920_c0_g1_i1:83-1021(-)
MASLDRVAEARARKELEEQERKNGVKQLDAKDDPDKNPDVNSCCQFQMHNHIILRLFCHNPVDVMPQWKRFIVFACVLACSAVIAFLIAIRSDTGLNSNLTAIGFGIIVGASVALFLLEEILVYLFESTENEEHCGCIPDCCCCPCQMVLYFGTLGAAIFVSYYLAQQVANNPSYALQVWGYSFAVNVVILTPIRLWMQWCCCINCCDKVKKARLAREKKLAKIIEKKKQELTDEQFALWLQQEENKNKLAMLQNQQRDLADAKYAQRLHQIEMAKVGHNTAAVIQNQPRGQPAGASLQQVAMNPNPMIGKK